MDKKLKLALKQNFAAPKPQQKMQFVNDITYPKAKLSAVIFAQIGFIRKRVWCLFALGVCFVLAFANVANMPQDTLAIISTLVPLLSLCMVSEIFKSAAHNMEEMELACKHNLQKVILMRILILGIASFITLLLFVTIANSGDYGLLRNIVYIFVPYLFTSYISLLIITKLRTKETIYICMAVSLAVSFFVMIAQYNYTFIYEINYVYIWVLLLAILALLLSYNLFRFVKSQEELQWNLL